MKSSKDNPAIDVIIPTYNSARWIKSSVESVITQTYKNINIYVIDDGSTDNTKEIINSIKDSRIHYITKKNGGVSSARNLGIKRSNAPYIAFLDADDLWHKDKLERQIQVMLNNPGLGIVYGGHYSINERGIIIRSLMCLHRGDVFEELCKGNIISGSASMALVPRNVLEDVGLFSNKLINGCEDWELWLRIARKYEVDYVDDILAEFRVLDDSMQNNNLKMAKNTDQLFQIVKSELVLSNHERHLLAETCYLDASIWAFNARKYKLARQYTRKLLKEYPRYLFKVDTWKFSIVPSQITKTLFGNALFMFIEKVYHKGWRGLNKVMQLLFNGYMVVYEYFKKTK